MLSEPPYTVPIWNRIEETISAAVGWLIRNQDASGFWAGVVESNSTIEAEWLLASHILDVTFPFENAVIRTLLNRQRPDGSWDVYPGAPDGDINSTVEAYAALRAKGLNSECEPLVRARTWISGHGGLSNVRVFTRYWLAMIGVWPWQKTPNLPPEIIRFPLWFPFNIYNFAQWARATIVPLTVVSAGRPVWPLPDGSKLEELFPDGYENFDFSITLKKTTPSFFERIFAAIDRCLHAAQNRNALPFRKNSIKLCLEWILRHQDSDGTWGGIQPSWIYSLIALHHEGYAVRSPNINSGIAALSSRWSYERNGTVNIQASESSVWDTLMTLFALLEAGHYDSSSPALQKALLWIVDKQVRAPGDWSVKLGDVEPGGWAFEQANVFYPDVDDTAIAILVLAKMRDGSGSAQDAVDAALRRGIAWLLAMQSSNGGWAAFDKDNDKKIVAKIPFCNFGEALDPPSVDVTAHVIEALAAVGFTQDEPVISRALVFIRNEQEVDGSWFGRWGVNHIYGTAAVLPALRAIGVDVSQTYIRKAARWIAVRQNIDGGWGETCESYMDPKLRGTGPSTPSQTAWAIMSLLAVRRDDMYRKQIERGVNYLCSTQTDEGTWPENYYTATGFPGYGIGTKTDLGFDDLSRLLQQGRELSRGFMLGFTMYRHYFPLLALARAQTALHNFRPARDLESAFPTE